MGYQGCRRASVYLWMNVEAKHSGDFLFKIQPPRCILEAYNEAFTEAYTNAYTKGYTIDAYNEA